MIIFCCKETGDDSRDDPDVQEIILRDVFKILKTWRQIVS